MEIWKAIEGTDFEVSNFARIRNNNIIKQTYTYDYNNRKLRFASIKYNNKWKTRHLHRLVAECFIGQIDQTSCVKFIDGDSTNCNLENLKIISRETQNIHNFNKLFNQRIEVKCYNKYTGEYINTFSSIFKASKELNIPQPNISANINGRLKSVSGYFFKINE
jgi:hypothetical protein